MNAYSLDLRLKALAAVDRGIPRKEGAGLAPGKSPRRTPSMCSTAGERRMLSGGSSRWGRVRDIRGALPGVYTLQEGQIVVMDNLRVHKSRRVEELIEEAGAEVLFLPPYSPDFSPIEEAFSEVKGLLRRARTLEALLQATGEALDVVSRRDAPGWFGHCGYDVAHHLL